MGRLTLHILLSFAEFERQSIAERSRDKVAAARRKEPQKPTANYTAAGVVS